MNRPILAAAAAACLLALAVPASAQQIKVGTVAPEGSPWHDMLLDLNARWKKVSGGTISLRIYPSGTQGDEPDMIRKMRIGQLHAAALTSVGMETIATELNALSIPFLFESWEEVDFVRDRLATRLKKALEDRDFVVLTWGDAGWVHFFTVTPAPRPADLQKLMLFTWGNNPRTEEMYKDAGFRVMPLAATEILQSLQTGKIQAFPAPPIAALASQWFGGAKNMTTVKFAPVVGGAIISKAAWERIDPALRPQLLKEAEEVGRIYKPKIRKLEGEAIAAMQKYGLNVVTVTPEIGREWKATAEKVYPKLRGGYLRAEDFDEVMALVKEYRAKAGK
ncbi:MAG TPA: TRAP transporter substrate-binding protein DctP [Vicinamibacterales bacterium]|nr:TRAP transporter substrate-binding protein DctP [Vicinamibacterales bacterium]